MENKVKLITPFLMLLAGAIASIIMYIRHFDLFTMLWVLLLVLVIFYVIGDIVRYIYESIRPRIIPDMDEDFDSESDFDSVITKQKIQTAQSNRNNQLPRKQMKRKDNLKWQMLPKRKVIQTRILTRSKVG